MVKYVYNAWGKILSTTGSLASTLGAVQPFRYRSYVYDQETGLYYLRSRYFTPVNGRFINADTIMKGNLFSYCHQNPIINIDQNGRWGSSTRQLNVLILFDMLYDMLEDGLDRKTKWLYSPGQKFRRVDCIGMICYCAEQHLTKEAFGPNGFNVKKGTRLARDYNMNEEKFIYIRSSKHIDGVLPEELTIGCTLYYEKDQHVGIYVGYFEAPDGKIYEHGVIHCSSKNGEVRIEELEDTSFVKACTFNYINYTLPRDYDGYYRPPKLVEDDDPWWAFVD